MVVFTATCGIKQIVDDTEGHFTQSAMIYLLYCTQPTKTTSIRTQLDALNIFNTSTKTITKIIEKMEI